MIEFHTHETGDFRLPMSEVVHALSCQHFTVTKQYLSMYILEQWSSCGTSRIRPSWPLSGHVLNPPPAPSYKHASCWHTQPGV
jgi:hypothetical protein